MYSVDYKTEKAVLTVFLNGRVDSANSAAVEAEINNIKSENKADEMIIDASGLEYISSAGLRILLRLRNEFPALKIVEVSSDVYDVFEMTGFSEIINIEKAYRRLSVEGCEVIGKGANGKVYRLDPDTIIKVYFNSDCLPDIRRERELARKAFVLGIPTAIPYDVVKVGDSYGSVFELLNAKSFTKILAEEPDRTDEIAEKYVKLLKKIHSTEVAPDDMPDMKATALNWAEFLKDYLPEDTFNKLYALIGAVPECHHMIHGDFHTKNIMLQNGEVLLIDMDTLSQGDAVFEFASIFNAFVGFYDLTPEIRGSFIGLDPDISLKFWEKIIRLYFGTQDGTKIDEIKRKSMLVGYTRLMRRLIRRNGFETQSGREEIEFYREKIIEFCGSVKELSLNL